MTTATWLNPDTSEVARRGARAAVPAAGEGGVVVGVSVMVATVRAGGCGGAVARLWPLRGRRPPAACAGCAERWRGPQPA